MSIWGIAFLALIAYYFPTFFFWWMVIAALGALIMIWESFWGWVTRNDYK